jgi:hypothetical protein
MAAGLRGKIAHLSEKYYISDDCNSGNAFETVYLARNGEWTCVCDSANYYDTHVEAVDMLVSKGVTEYQDLKL